MYGLLAASNVDIPKPSSTDGSGRTFLRLNTVPIKIPPLREREKRAFAFQEFLQSILQRITDACYQAQL
jgi:transcriptional regulator with AAA-type ATPase domain